VRKFATLVPLMERGAATTASAVPAVLAVALAASSEPL
jgi:hypothetical protein